MASDQNTEEHLRTALADRYRIESEIDSGGMATVYRAQDLKHDRTVAIKVLRPELAEAIGADRFLREIRTTANLNHPNILPLHDSGEADGFLFYVMPYVKGESLGDRLEREGQLPIEDAVQIAREVAEALAYAHREGVIHRDIKPANIMLAEGHALLADFGIAQAKAGAEETKLTGSGMSLGTPSYMSPEQVGGEGELDGRADQYALGCVLYEMLAGHPPFTGADIQTVMRQHLAVDAPSVTQARPSVPKGVAKTVHRSLAKTPADRFRTTAEFETALAGATLPFLARIPLGRARTALVAAAFVLVLATVAIVVSLLPKGDGLQLVPNRVVVMPFENLTGDPALNEWTDLVADYVGEAIQRLELVDPIAVDLARHYAEEAASEGSVDVVRAVANAFEAALAVTGSIYAMGDSLQYRLNVIDVASGRSLQPVEEIGPRDSPGAAIERLGEQVAGALAMELDPYMEQGAQSLPSPPRLEAYRRNKLGFESYERGDVEKALEHQLAAYDLDTTFVYPLVYAGFWASRLGDRAMADSLLQFADLRRDMLSALGNATLDGSFGRINNDREAVLRAARESHRLDPRGWSPLGHAFAALDVARPREAIEALQDYDPNPEWRRSENFYYWGALCKAYHMLGEHEQELVEAKRAREMNPDRLNMLILEIQAQAALGRVAEVNSLLDQAPALSPNPVEAAEVAGNELWTHGFPDEARAAFERGIQWLQDRPEGEGNRRWLGMMLYGAGRWEEAHTIFRALDAEQPEDLWILGRLGRSAARTGDTATAREISRRIAGMPWPEYEYRHLMNLAFLAAILGEPDEAMRLFQESIARGDPNRQISHHRQPDLEALYQREDWHQLMGPKG